eukprot:TRINITY_DN6963_c0_g1_i1.p1 TRINITY_DN6963_c0_g1~~TRINITY_DN6963_c0_g1_i1.p1  ORF type:complete len:286 (+),score=33.96 TRINITY_DN6963_c0_g1_i1:54-911(+)
MNEHFMKGVRNVIAVSSCKGGVGKSTTAVNLALAFKNLGRVTGLLDADIQGPSIHKMLNLHKLQGIKGNPEGKMIPPQNFGIKAMSFGMLLSNKQAMVTRGPLMAQQVTQLLQSVDWGDLDILVIDLPPGTHDVHLTITQKLKIDGAVIVTTPQEIATMDTERGMDMFSAVKVPMLGLVENMSYFICNNCDKKHFIFGEEGNSREVAESFGIPFLGSIPLDPENRSGADAGHPVAHLGEHGHRLAPPYYDLARAILKNIDERPEEEGLKIEFEDENDDPPKASSA